MRLEPLAGARAQEIDDADEHLEPGGGGDEDQPGEALRPREGEGLGDRAAHRVPDEDDPARPQRLDERGEPVRVPGDARPAAASVGPVARQVGRHDARHVGEPLELGLPEIGGPAGAVDQDQRRSGPGLEPRPRPTGDGPGSPGRRHHMAPRAVIGQSASTRPPRTATYQSWRLIVGSQ